MKLPLFLALTLAAAVSASAQVVSSNWQRLDGQHSGIKESLAVAVQDSKKWEEIWTRHQAGAPLPPVDFEKESVVVVFLGQTLTSGVKVDIVVQKDPIDSNRLNVFYKQVVTHKAFSAQVQCEPFAFVKVPKAAVIDIEANGRVSVPENERAPANKPDQRKMRGFLERLEGAVDWN